MKKFLALLLTLVMALSLAACGGSDEESTGSPAEDPAANEESSGSAADVKIGLICVHDINSGYDAAHIEGLTAACEELGIDANSQVIFRYNIAEDENCYDAAVDLAEEGCNIIFSDSYGHQSYMLDAAEDYPDVTFVSCTGDMAATSGLDNYKNLFPYTYESRYVSGVVAGHEAERADGRRHRHRSQGGLCGCLSLCRGGLWLHRFPAGHPDPGSRGLHGGPVHQLLV